MESLVFWFFVPALGIAATDMLIEAWPLRRTPAERAARRAAQRAALRAEMLWGLRATTVLAGALLVGWVLTH